MILSNRHRSWIFAALAVSVAALSGCASEPPQRPNATQDVAVDLAAAQEMISSYRRSQGLPAVVVDPGLVAMAPAQARSMASADQMSHDVNGSFVERLAAAQRQPSAAVENVAAGQASFSQAMDAWRHSFGHNANLLNPFVSRMGIAVSLAPTTRYKRFWALVMTD